MRLHFALNPFSLYALTACTFVACDTKPTEVEDAGADTTVADTAKPTRPLSCSSPMMLDGILGTVTTTVDTTMVSERPSDLGLNCGNPSGSAIWSPQSYLAYKVPGTGQKAISFSTLFPQTRSGNSNDLVVIVQLRREACTLPTENFPPNCFGPVGGPQGMEEWRSRGNTTAMGGDTVYFLLTGYASLPAERMLTDRGTIRIDITATDAVAPTLASGFASINGNSLFVEATGTDSDMNAAGMLLRFYKANALVDLTNDEEAEPNVDVVTLAFSPMPTTATFTASGTRTEASNSLAAFLATAEVDQVGISVFDQSYATSSEVKVTLIRSMSVCAEQICNGRETVCASPYTCDIGTCKLTIPEVMIPTPTDVMQSTSITNTLSPGAGGSVGQQTGVSAPTACANNVDTSGPELAYLLVVPPGAYDLRLNAQGPAATFDTVLYVKREGCPHNVVACNDDINTMAMNYASSLEMRNITPGRYLVYVEAFGGQNLPASLQLNASLVPLLATAAACDNMQIQNRCMGSACTNNVCP